VTEKEERRKWRLAQVFSRRVLLKRCMDSIKMYTVYRKKKEMQKRKLNEYAESQLVYRVFRTWCEKFEYIQKANEIEDEIVLFRNKYLLARVLNYWKCGTSD
jgi:hypothetical protein